jgi:hypothetical protein
LMHYQGFQFLYLRQKVLIYSYNTKIYSPLIIVEVNTGIYIFLTIPVSKFENLNL